MAVRNDKNLVGRIQPSILTRRLELRPFSPFDWPVWRSAVTPKGNVTPVDGAGRAVRASHWSKVAFLAKISRHRKLARADSVYVWGIFRRTTGELVGLVDLGILRRETLGWANVGYMIWPDWRGRGFAPEAVRAVIKHGFTALDLRRIEAAISRDNRSSIRVAEKCGLVRECVRKAFWTDAMGEVDAVIHVAMRTIKSAKQRVR